MFFAESEHQLASSIFCRFPEIWLQRARHLPGAFAIWKVGSVQQRLTSTAGEAPTVLPCLAAALFNLGTIVVLLALFRVLVSIESVMISLLFHRNWYPWLACNVVGLVLLLLPNTLPEEQGSGKGSAVSLLTCGHQLWDLILLLKNLPRLGTFVSLQK